MIEKLALDTLKYLPLQHLLMSGAATTFTNCPAALTEMGGAATPLAYRRTADLRYRSEWRFQIGLRVAGSAGTVMGVQYSLDAAASWQGLDNGTNATISTLTFAMDSGPNVTYVTAWAAINPLARVENCLLRIVTSGGDAAADPAISTIIIEVR